MDEGAMKNSTNMSIKGNNGQARKCPFFGQNGILSSY